MPLLGEIRTTIQRGLKKGGTKYLWTECEVCHKERWVALRNGKPRNKRCHHCALLSNKHPNWKGGRRKSGGRIYILLQPDDFFYPMVDKKGYVFEHRLVMAKHIGRNLHSWEIVHHKRGIAKDDNRIEGLQLVTDDRHRQITILENHIIKLEKENRKLREQLDATS